MENETYLLLKHRNELFQKIKNTALSEKKIKKYNFYIKKTYFFSKKK